MTLRRTLIPALLSLPAVAEARPPIIDMHIHARRLDYDGSATPPLCAPPTTMPRWDNARPLDEGLSPDDLSCADPVLPERSGEAVMQGTLEVMQRRNIIAMASGEPEDIARWRAAAPERIIAGLDLRIVPRPPSARFRARPPEEVRALHAAGAFQLLGEVMA